MDRSIINKYKNEKDKLLISKVIDKIRFCETKNKIQTTDFLDEMEQKLLENFLKSQKISNYFYTGGFEEAERKILIIYPEKLEDIIANINLNDYISSIRIELPNEMHGEYTHKNYLGRNNEIGHIKRKNRRYFSR